jgi:hypothetical protein
MIAIANNERFCVKNLPHVQSHRDSNLRPSKLPIFETEISIDASTVDWDEKTGFGILSSIPNKSKKIHVFIVTFLLFSIEKQFFNPSSV